MKRSAFAGLAGIVGILALSWVVAARAQGPVPVAERPAAPEKPLGPTYGGNPRAAAQRARGLRARLVETSGVAEEDVTKVLQALGPIVTDELANGQTIDLPGLGRFRVVRVAGHKDMVNGRPANIAAVNTVEFMPFGNLGGAANAKTARPAETIPAFEYNPLPNQTKGAKAPNNRQPNVRTR